MKKEHDLKIPAKIKINLLNVKSEAVILVMIKKYCLLGWDAA